MPAISEQKNLFAARLDARIRRADRNGRLNRWIAYAVVTGTIASSFAALMMSVNRGWDPNVIGTVAAVPALLAALEASFKFDQRANWFYRRVNALRRIEAKLLYAKDGEADLVQLSNELCDLVETLSEDFPQLAAADFKPPGKPKAV